MKKTILILLIIPLLLSVSCSDCSFDNKNTYTGISIAIYQYGFARSRIVDADNLPEEQTINTIAVLFTEPSGTVFTHKYINTGFSTSGDYKIVTVPLEASELGTKDIYVITNYGDMDIESFTDLEDLNAATTPKVDKTNNLDPLDGFCMYGKTMTWDFVANPGIPAPVAAVRTCAKIRLTVNFPEQLDLSTDNSFLITHAASYTHLTDDTTWFVLPSSQYFNFAAALPLIRAADGSYTAVTYVYEATQVAGLQLYTHIDGSPEQQTFSADLPIPYRNCLYDISIRVYRDEAASSGDIFMFETVCMSYSPEGILTDIYENISPINISSSI